MKPLAFLLPLALGACAHMHPENSPPPYIMLNIGVPILLDLAGSATQITPDTAATARHVSGIITPDSWNAREPMDIAYYHTRDATPVPIAAPVKGETVIAWGTSPITSGAHHLYGKVIELVVGMCHGPETSSGNPWDNGDGASVECHRRHMGVVKGFVFDTEAPGGYSGGPVLNARGELVGITTDTIKLFDGRTGTFAYWAEDVMAAK